MVGQATDRSWEGFQIPVRVRVVKVCLEDMPYAVHCGYCQGLGTVVEDAQWGIV